MMLFNAITHTAPPQWIVVIGTVAVSLNSIIDPILFLWVSPDNRKSLVGFLSLAWAFVTCQKIVPLTKKAFDVSGSSSNSRATTVKVETSFASRDSVVAGSPSSKRFSSGPPIPELALPASADGVPAASPRALEALPAIELSTRPSSDASTARTSSAARPSSDAPDASTPYSDATSTSSSEVSTSAASLASSDSSAVSLDPLPEIIVAA